MAFVRAMVDFMVLHDVIKDADVSRLKAIAKRLIPLFIGLTLYKSKYSIELINFITKIELSMSLPQPVAVKLRAFVNTVEPLMRGHPDKRPTPLERTLETVNININGLISTPDEGPPLLKGHFSGAKGVAS